MTGNEDLNSTRKFSKCNWKVPGRSTKRNLKLQVKVIINISEAAKKITLCYNI